MVHRWEVVAALWELRVPVLSVGDCTTKLEVGNVYRCRRSLPTGVMLATGVLVEGLPTLVSGVGDVGKGCACDVRGAGVCALVTEAGPVFALPAWLEGQTAGGGFKLFTRGQLELVNTLPVLAALGSPPL